MPTPTQAAARRVVLAATAGVSNWLVQASAKGFSVVPLASSNQPFGTGVALAVPVGAVLGYVCAVYANMMMPELNADVQAWSFTGSMLVGLFALCAELME
jgi:hypothetical protein